MSYIFVPRTLTVHSSVFLPVAHAWLRHHDHALSMRVTVESIDTTTQPITQSINYVLSRPRPVVVNDGARKSRQGSISVLLHSVAERQAWVNLTKDGTPLYFACPPAWGWEFSSGYMSLGEIAWTNPAGIGRDPWRIVTAPFVLVDRPT